METRLPVAFNTLQCTAAEEAIHAPVSAVHLYLLLPTCSLRLLVIQLHILCAYPRYPV